MGDTILDPMTHKSITVSLITIQNLSNMEPVYDLLGATGNDYIVNGGYLADKLP